MGSSSSKPNKSVIIARSNFAARGIYALYGITDKIFPHNINLPRLYSDKVILDKKIEEINLEISKKLKKEFNKSNNELEDDPVLKVQDLISKSKKIETISYNSSTHGDHLIMCKENIYEISNEIGELKNLLLCQLCCNYIYKIPPSIIYLQKLMTLSLARNQLRFIPEEICELSSLTHLDLSFNFLVEMPHNLKKLKSLTSLNLENNLFIDIPLEISKLRSLRNLQISNNPIKDVPLQILKMPFLVDFDASSSTLVYEDVFKKVGNLDLREICLRNVVLNILPVYKNIDRLLIESLFNVEECGFCGGPIFDAYFFIKTSEVHENKEYPVKYKICRKHFKDQRNRIGAFFGRSHDSIPYNILINHNISIRDIFYGSVEIKKRHKLYGIFSRRMQLWELSKFNNPETKKTLFKKVDQNFYN
ncbi:leucine-rich repeat-containing protein [Vairimorpha necatrix]|uniref:Leucine-rich repeat-containing protein n=1 Tax=Vairimorpha necatrix TaxID=6039 RepID=A0AAX4JA44_9MICR